MNKVPVRLHRWQVEYLIGLLENQKQIRGSIIKDVLRGALLQTEIKEIAREKELASR